MCLQGGYLTVSNFDRLCDSKGVRLTDAHLRRKLASNYFWITRLYESTSDFVHLSMRHYYASIASVDHDTREVWFLIGGSDPPRSDKIYFEVVDAFFEVSKLLSLELLGYFLARANLSGEPAPERPTG
jgi:hypothetical protein